jgi:hypothetical protein
MVPDSHPPELIMGDNRFVGPLTMSLPMINAEVRARLRST